MMQANIALLTGLGYLAAAGFAVPAVKVLGPSYRTHATVHPGLIGFGVFYALVLLFQGVTVLFPARAGAVEALSLFAPLLAWTLVVLNALLLDFIMRHRAPPPLFERIIRWVIGRSLGDEAVEALAFALPPANVGDVPSDEPVHGEMPRSQRVLILLVSAALLAAVVWVVVASSPVAS